MPPGIPSRTISGAGRSCRSVWRTARCRRARHPAAPASRPPGRDRLDSGAAPGSEAQSGDPGIVLARRLSNAEFDYTIRDLTGVDIRPTREFPVDPANEAGFDNSGESLAMSPALLKKYLAGGPAGRRPRRPETGRLRLRAASGGDRHRPRQVLRPAHHRLLQAPPVDFADYFLAAWRYQPSRGARPSPTRTLRDARDRRED